MPETTRLLRFGDYTFPIYQHSYSDNFANVVTNTVRLPGVDGGYDTYGSYRSPSEIGTIRASMSLYATTRGAMSAYRDALKALAYKGRQQLWMKPGDLTERWCWARVNAINIPETRSAHTDYFQPFDITFHVPDPAWNVNTTEENSTWGSPATLWGTAIWSGDSGQSANLTTASNAFGWTVNGNLTTYPRIVINTTTSMSNLRVQRIVNGSVVDEVGFTGSLAAGRVEFNCRDLTAVHTPTGQSAVNIFTNAAFVYRYPNFFRLEVGYNDMRVLADNSLTGTVTMYYLERYR